MPTVTIRGQRVSRMRIGGQWVEVDENGVPVQEPGPDGDTATATPNGSGDIDYSKMSRKELNAVAEEKGLNPKDYRNRDLLTGAILGA